MSSFWPHQQKFAYQHKETTLATRQFDDRVRLQGVFVSFSGPGAVVFGSTMSGLAYVVGSSTW
jgi:hypothetical protein